MTLIKAISVKHTNVIAHATSRATSRRFSNTLLDHYQNSATTYASAIGHAIILKTVIFSSCVAPVAAPVVALVCEQSRDFRVCRRVPRRVHNHPCARVHVGVLCTLFLLSYKQLIFNHLYIGGSSQFVEYRL